MVENGKKSYIKMRSIARKISVEWNFKIIFDFLIIDIIFAAAKIFYWRVSQEAMYFERNILEKENILLKGEFVYQKGVSISEFIENLYYDIPGSDYFIYAGDAFTETVFLFGVLLVTEILMIIIGFFKGGKKVRRKLEPLDKLAATAQMISTASFDFEKIHDLEDALDKIDTDRDDESELKVSTGNTELQGIENAIKDATMKAQADFINGLELPDFIKDGLMENNNNDRPIVVIMFLNVFNIKGQIKMSLSEYSQRLIIGMIF